MRDEEIWLSDWAHNHKIKYCPYPLVVKTIFNRLELKNWSNPKNVASIYQTLTNLMRNPLLMVQIHLSQLK